jgi:hypothetical protein
MESTREKFVNTLLPRVLIPIAEAAPLIGMSYQSARIHLSRGTFPIRTRRQGRLRFIHLDDLANYLFADPPSGPTPSGPTKKRGRPTKREQRIGRGMQ